MQIYKIIINYKANQHLKIERKFNSLDQFKVIWKKHKQRRLQKINQQKVMSKDQAIKKIVNNNNTMILMTKMIIKFKVSLWTKMTNKIQLNSLIKKFRNIKVLKMLNKGSPEVWFRN